VFDFVIGQYLINEFGAKVINISFETTLIANATGALSLADATDSAFILSKIGTSGDLFLVDCLAKSQSFVELSLLPDLNSSLRIRLDANPDAVRTPFPLPVIVSTDVNIQYINGTIPNNLYLNFTAISMNKVNSLAFQYWASNFIGRLMSGGAAQQTSGGGGGQFAQQQQASAGKACKRRKPQT
jgi:hypothetical protein